MADTTLPGVLLKGTAASRPAASAVAKGTVYSATDTGAITQSDGVSTWSTWATISSGMTNPMSAVGDMIQGTTAGAPAALAAPAAGKVLTGAGTTTPLVYSYPPGYEFDYAQVTSNTNVTATAEASANTIITGGAVTYDGSTIVMVECFFPYAQEPSSDSNILLVLYDGSGSIGLINMGTGPTATGYSGNLRFPNYGGQRRLTPSNASHTYSIRAYVSGGTGVLAAGAGGSGAFMPAFMRIVKV